MFALSNTASMPTRLSGNGAHALAVNQLRNIFQLNIVTILCKLPGFM